MAVMPRILARLHNLAPGTRPFLASLLLGAAGLAGLHAWWLLTPTPLIQAGARVVEIGPHQGVMGVAQQLETEGVIRSRLGFLVLAALRGTARSLKAGEYELPRDVNTVQILRFLEEGKVRQHPVLFPEGGTARELARTLEAEGLTQAEAVQRLSQDARFLWTLGLPGPTIEGYLFPDTYRFFKGLTPEEMLGRMVHRLRAKVTDELLAQAESLGLTFHQLLTLASIIEKEAVIREEMPLISAVFWNRMKRDMPLQADPTVQYALGKDRQALTRDDLQVDSPFNTYRIRGLPPGPIASPGKAAIVAALNPAKVNYLYFVSTGDQRRHFFSVTLEQHNSAVARYRVAKAR
ncbi:MAG: endolytic transglycosylase MltG [Candidatus Rokubacteria bacterium]|nr:endolytic transglycosylase MltG [Candidatus Rokubacteria bacterium]